MLLSVQDRLLRTFKMEPTRTSKTLVHMYHTIRRHIAEDGNCVLVYYTLHLTHALRNFFSDEAYRCEFDVRKSVHHHTI